MSRVWYREATRKGGESWRVVFWQHESAALAMRRRLCLELLGLTEATSSATEVRQAYLAQAKRWHPDRSGITDAEQFRSIHQAYSELVDATTQTAWPFDGEEADHLTVSTEEGWNLDGAFVQRLTKLVEGNYWVVTRTFEADGSYSKRAERREALIGSELAGETAAELLDRPAHAEHSDSAPAQPPAVSSLKAMSLEELLHELKNRGVEFASEELAKLNMGADYAPVDSG